MAATNRVDILILQSFVRDDSTVRLWSEDRIFRGRGDLQGSCEGKPLSEEINLQQIAQTTAGFTGADLENLLNEAAILRRKG